MSDTSSTVRAAPPTPFWVYALLAVLTLWLVYLGNPAVALLCGIALSLASGRSLLKQASQWSKFSLQAAIVLLGLKLNAAQLFKITSDYSLMVSGFLLATIGIGLAIGYALRCERQSNILISSGTAICGGTAIASIGPVISARAEQIAVAMALVFLLNAVALFTFPTMGHWLELSQQQFGVWCALAIHDTSSVVATSALYGEEAMLVATTVKLGRTLWLIPLLLLFSISERRSSTQLRVPGFVLLFIAAAVLSSVIAMPQLVVQGASMVSSALLVIALFLIGLGIERATLKALRGRVLLLGVVLWLLVVPAALIVARTVA